MSRSNPFTTIQGSVTRIQEIANHVEGILPDYDDCETSKMFLNRVWEISRLAQEAEDPVKVVEQEMLAVEVLREVIVWLKQ